MPTDIEISRAVDTLRRLENLAGVGSGASLSPRYVGDDIVAAVTDLRVIATVQTFGSTLVTLVWEEPAGVSTYRVWATNILKANTVPLMLGEFQSSPAQVLVTSDVDTVVVLQVQPVLANGQAGKLENSPTVTAPVNVSSTVIPDGSITALKFAPGAVSAAIAAGEIDTSKLNIYAVMVVGMTLTNNSPSAGKVAWSSCTVYYQGTPYAISSGSTGATTNKFITWTVGATSFSAVDSYAPAPNVFLVATNTGGTADTAWNKIAQSHIQEDQLAVSLLKGFQPQTPSTGTIGNTAGSSTTIVSYTGPGALLSVTIQISTPYVANTAAILSILSLDITLDGSTTQTYSFVDTTGAIGVTCPWSFQAFAAGPSAWSGTGTSAGDTFVVYFGLSFTTSCSVVVKIDPTAGATAGGAANIGVNWAKKTI